MQGERSEIVGGGGVRIGVLTAGTGPELLLVHGGMGRLEAWGPIWDRLTERRTVTAMDRRGRGASGDDPTYALSDEYEDVAAVVGALADRQGAPIDVFGHSYGGVCALGAAAAGDARIRRLALYEPPGPQTAPAACKKPFRQLVSPGAEPVNCGRTA